MKRLWILLWMCLITGLSAAGQSEKSLTQNKSAELYLDVTAPNSTALELLLHNFVVDNVTYNTQNQNFTVRVWLPRKQFANFDTLHLSYSIVSVNETQYTVTLASSYPEMVANWDKYPTYNTYLALMDSFQKKYPQWCSVETVLNATPGNHKILIAHLGVQHEQQQNRPSFLYSSTMHGDEVAGFYLLLRLIHHLLTNAATNPQVQNILNNIDLWILPLINPDGTYHTHNNIIGTSPISTRSNHNGEDINRSFPQLSSLIAGSSSGSYEPEVQAMMNFFNTHHFVMSANLHGGTELFNYPWDNYTTTQRPHPDHNWFYYVGRNFANTCHAQNNSYFTGENNGVTEGGDWYVITGSQQDWANYAAHCKEVSIEVNNNKVVKNNNLNPLWNYTHQAFLDYIEEALNGLRGIITDSLTDTPLAAQVFIQNHDADHSEVYSALPAGNYHRPVKGGNYTVHYSAAGYYTKTCTTAVTDGATTVKNVKLTPISQAIPNSQTAICRIYPNPASDYINIETEKNNLTAEIRDIAGKLLNTVQLQNAKKFNIQNYATGIYFIQIKENGNAIEIRKIIKN
ncbi:MAG: T9SS type A sorting domain-containing protein [Bacteroidales bacterium]|jgi:hypothetical protein|nr:T9SS type A sorting domain-containing protein [Bacteroidales bacterium]